MERSPWINRSFKAIDDNGLLPGIIERLEGTPSRIRNKVKDADEAFLDKSINSKWSIKQEIGHLADLEPLWFLRLEQLIKGVPEMSPADMTNRKTTEADHNEKSAEELIKAFEVERNKLVSKLRGLHEVDLLKSSIHPRLKINMRIVDLAYFVAEHDDHHLVQIKNRERAFL